MGFLGHGHHYGAGGLEDPQAQGVSIFHAGYFRHHSQCGACCDDLPAPFSGVWPFRTLSGGDRAVCRFPGGYSHCPGQIDACDFRCGYRWFYPSAQKGKTGAELPGAICRRCMVLYRHASGEIQQQLKTRKKRKGGYALALFV